MRPVPVKAGVFIAVIALAMLLGAAIAWKILPPCSSLDITATEDSIRARQQFYNEHQLRTAIRKHLIDSIDSLPTPQELEPIYLDYVRRLDLERQLMRAEQDPS